MSEFEQPCPICGVALPENQRYPDHLCRDCATRAKAVDGRVLEFFNVDMSGGFMARFADDQTPYNSHVCYVDGHMCWADEARFGGIVIRPAPDGEFPRDDR